MPWIVVGHPDPIFSLGNHGIMHFLDALNDGRRHSTSVAEMAIWFAHGQKLYQALATANQTETQRPAESPHKNGAQQNRS